MDLTEIEKAVAEGRGFAAMSVRDLRNAHGAARAKVHVVAAISTALREAGYGHIPVEIPKDEKRSVIVFRRPEPGAIAIGAVIMSMMERLCLGGEEAAGTAFGLAMAAPYLQIGSALPAEGGWSH